MDLYYGYDGKENDYDVKVEVVEMSVKAEKAQLTYMAIGNTKPEKDLIARYIGDIDKDIIPDLGFEDDELKDILAIADDNSNGMVEDALGDFLSDDDIATEGIAETQTPAVMKQETPIEEGIQTDTPEMDDEAKKAHVKSIKEKTEKLAAARQQSENAYTILSFSTAEAKEAFMDIVGCNPDAKFVKGEDVLRLIE